MLSYRHAFHAGNFADVFKHALLCLMLESLKEKDKPFCYLETHAGAGRYNLSSAPAQKNREYEGGIQRLWKSSDVPPALTSYLNVVIATNGAPPPAALRYYPGSPRIARHLLREQDRMVLCELHSSEYPVLKQEFAGERQIAIHHQDGYVGLKAHLPPRERRGLVLIDPAFELKDECTRAIQGLALAHQRWSTGIFALWYPILDLAFRNRLLRQVEDLGISKVLVAELSVGEIEGVGPMAGTGMVVINPPWGFDEQLRQVLPWLQGALSPEGRGRREVFWLVPE